MKKKKVIAVILTILLFSFAFSGCNETTTTTDQTEAPQETSSTEKQTENTEETETEDPFAEPVHFTAATFITEDGNYNNDAIYDLLSEKFNFTYELYPLTYAEWAEKNRLWITAGDMPDWTFWNFNFTEYVNYADQGLIAAMPDGWEEKFVNLNQMIEVTGIKDKINIDGKTYTVPKAIFNLFAPIKKVIDHTSLYYRDDWREQLGLEEFGDMITLDQMEAYLSGCIDEGLTPEGLSSSYTNLSFLFVSMGNSGYDDFYKKDGEYVWGPAQPETLTGIKLFKEYYDKGIINHDFYLNEVVEARSEFNSGLVAMFYGSATVDNTTARINEFVAVNEDLADVAYDIIKITNVLAPDGKWHGSEYENFWCSTLFSPSIDSAVLDRILYLFDYLCTEDGQLLVHLGIEDVDWESDGSGGYTILREKNEDGTYAPLSEVYPSRDLWYTLTILPDDIGFVDPTLDQDVMQSIVNMYSAKEEYGDIFKFDPDYTYYVSDAKSNFSVDVDSEIVRLIISEGVDIDAEWAAFIKEQEPLYQPLLDELNAEFGK